MVESQSKRVLVIETVLNNFKSHQTVLIMVTVLIIVSCIIWPMYSTYNSDILKKWETVLIIVTVLIIMTVLIIAQRMVIGIIPYAHFCPIPSPHIYIFFK